MKKRYLKLKKIRLDGGTQPRAGIVQSVVDDYVVGYDAGDNFPPAVVFYDGKDYWLADGFHRYHAAEKCGLDGLLCDVRPGSVEDARWYSYSANQAHGLRRSNADKERAVRAALLHPKGAGLSDSQIAEHVGVDGKTVAKYREELVAASELPKVTHRTGKDGKVYNTANIGGAAVEVMEPEKADDDIPPDVVPVVDDQQQVVDQEQLITPEQRARSKAIFLANEAIDVMKRIPRNDPLRERGWQIVDDWLHSNWPGQEGRKSAGFDGNETPK